ncbi:MAG: UDP-N-acetylmuramate dehydrogenase [Candidatus Rokubacteria bacterium]|nr:UDP-N-acetylmuramate dehydrogenase [Candidatus Rokubacteria bacterium]
MTADPVLDLRERVPLAPLTTLGVGGGARWFVEARDEATVQAALEWARARRMPLLVLGGGSNLVVGDGGVDALVVKIALRGVDAHPTRGGVEVTAAAGEPWDALVATTVARGWAGFECLSGIPGLVGATPIQNVGAYGQEISETVVAVRALDAKTGRVTTLVNAKCRFSYRDSLFKSGEPGRHVVLAVSYRLAPGGAPAIRYADVERDLAGRGVARPTLADVRESVVAIRRAKSMVIDPGDPNRRSCGSFFTNPVVPADALPGIEARVGGATMPRWPERDGRVKLSAAWLIERAGFRRGHVEGAVGLSTRHALAIVAHDGATAADVVALARRIQATVAERFGVRLTPEPQFWAILPA